MMLVQRNEIQYTVEDVAQMLSYQSQVTTYQRHFILPNRHAVMFMETKPTKLRSKGYVRNEKMCTEYWVGNLTGRHDAEHLGTDGKNGNSLTCCDEDGASV